MTIEAGMTAPDGPSDAGIITMEQALEMGEADAALVEAGGEPDLATNAPRGKDGKFVKGAKAPAKPGPAKVEAVVDAEPEPPPEGEPAKEPAKDREVEAPVAALVEARRLLKSGKGIDALKKAFGDDFEPTMLDLDTPQWSGLKRQWKQNKTEVEKVRVRTEARALEVQLAAKNLMPLAQARVAYEAGKFEEAHQLAFGESVDQFQRRVIAKMHTPDRTDPAVQARLERLERERAEERQQAESNAKLAKERARAQATAAHKTVLGETYAAHEDARYAAVADDPRFIERIFEIECDNFDEKTRTTIAADDAAEQAWQELYGKAVQAVAGKTRMAALAPGGARVPRVNGESAQVRRLPPRAGVQHSRATEANPFDGLEGEDIWKAAEQTMKAQAARGH